MSSVIPSSISIGIVQYVWIMRIWTLNRHKRRTLIAYCMLSLVVLEWVASIVLLVRVFCISSFGFIPSITWLVATAISLMTINDLISSSYFCYLLHTSRDGLCATDTLINKLMIYGVNTGLLTCLGSLSLLAVLVAQPEKSYYVAIYVVVPKLYINSLLAMANWRSSVLSSTIRRTSQGEVSLQLTSVQLSTLSRCTQYEYTGT
ncbi:hypothetical protein A0H81_04629 [Grifola frondosa]|uniref:DUF6534 domain-containing protein n=1 Tax=Grifola frondosa TaxID=5627 RepID=A0A1C7MF21_GRIFR|nr:hypothetical protein A0H81_04629 [Grifola frondosa]